ncbi:membrane protein [Aureimonas sp. SA4125]|uniref:retropepsin-like aspartic protease family protein n=1 Tax=Aureimonas sp. SA4125 TaxID=2826993 RepID=UPI001CC5017D|nr:TIGR02281 family clan AA aspartic protease [Aureimonas sp. SA4125]BDA82641.1 membrane protein [Aureimonas sp. SA4125]
MIQKFLILAAGASAIAFAFPSAFQEYRDRVASAQNAEAVDPAPAVVKAATTPTYAGRVAQLQADSDGHFRTEARLNGRPIAVLVDTGATYVSMSETTARRLGLQIRSDAFRFKAQTANGETAVALATLDRVTIGQVDVRDVEALVTKGDVMPTTLLGMSFLSKLKRFDVEDGRLSLVE